MPIESTVRVSFDTDIPANRAANKALVGKPQGKRGSGPFEKVGTALYMSSGRKSAEVGAALADLGVVLRDHAASVDFVLVTLVRRPKPVLNSAEQLAKLR